MRESGPVTRPERRPRLRGRWRRGPLLRAVLAIGVVGAVLIVAVGGRPSAEQSVPLRIDDARVGTTYGLDGAICLDAKQGSPARVLGVEVSQAAGSTTRLVLPPDGAPPVIGFPVDDGGEPVDGYEVEPGRQDCTLRLLVTPEREGSVRAGTVRLRLGYGPFGLLRRTASVPLDVRLEVTGTGEDPRTNRQ